MAKEIERKFLVKDESWRSGVTSADRIRQGYVSTMEDRSVRLRVREDRATLTIKIGRNSFIRDEFEYPVPLADAEEMLTMAIGRVIEKTRHLVPVDGFTFEVDVFSGDLEGLVVAEVELRDVGDKPALPDWLGREVTGDERYSNLALATAPGPLQVKNGLSD